MILHCCEGEVIAAKAEASSPVAVMASAVAVVVVREEEELVAVVVIVIVVAEGEVFVVMKCLSSLKCIVEKHVFRSSMNIAHFRPLSSRLC